MDAFREQLDDPASDVWHYDDGSIPAPVSVTDRDALMSTLGRCPHLGADHAEAHEISDRCVTCLLGLVEVTEGARSLAVMAHRWCGCRFAWALSTLSSKLASSTSW